MMGSMPPAVLGKRVGRIIKARRKQVCLGALVGRALVRGGHAYTLGAVLQMIELKRGDRWEDWQDPEKVYGSLHSGGHSGLAGKVVKEAQWGKRLASDLYDVASGRSRHAPSASVGGFKVTENSPNTIRVTAGPERRDRRKKYEWERVETQRRLQKLAVTAASVAAATGAIYVSNKGKGSFKEGAKIVAKETTEKGRAAGRAIADLLKGRAPRSSPKKTRTNSEAQQKANRVAEEAKPKPDPEDNVIRMPNTQTGTDPKTVQTQTIHIVEEVPDKPPKKPKK
jgi:hypothetical protein